MKKAVIMLLCIALWMSGTVGYAELRPNNHVYCENNGEYSSREGTYIKKTHSRTIWGFVSLYAERVGTAQKCYSTAAYLYSRETADRVTNVGVSDVYKSHGYAYPSSADEVIAGNPIQYSQASYAVLNRTYKTVVKMQGLSGYQPNRIYLYTVP